MAGAANLVNETHKKHLWWLNKLGADQCSAMVSLAAEMLHQGATPDTDKQIASAANKLGMEVEDVSNALAALSHLSSETARQSLAEQDLIQALSGIGVSGDSAASIAQACVESKDRARLDVLRGAGVRFPQYKSADWRLECTVGGRSLRSVAEPGYLVQVVTEEGGVCQTHTIQSEYSGLQNVLSSLKAALHEEKGGHYRKVVRMTGGGSGGGVGARS